MVRCDAKSVVEGKAFKLDESLATGGTSARAPRKKTTLLEMDVGFVAQMLYFGAFGVYREGFRSNTMSHILWVV
jgi:hypothetical protein